MEQENIEEDEPVDQELQKAMKNVQIDDSAFTSDKTQDKSNDKDKSKKNKKKKGEDFLDYASKNGIQVNLQYEDKAEFKKPQIEKPKDKFYPKKEEKTDTTNPKKTYQKKPYNPTSNYNSNYNAKPYKQKFRTGNNKFDLANMGMGGMSPMYNPYMMQGMLTPGMQNFPMQNMPLYSPQAQQSTLLNPTPQLNDNSDKSIIEYLEYYFSFENLNKDSFIRNKLDENGFLDADLIVNFNKMKRQGVSMEKLKELLGDNTNLIIETGLLDGKFVLRNRDWDNIKDKLVPREFLQQQKRQKYNNTMNYVNMQNNYFFTNPNEMLNQFPMMVNPMQMPMQMYPPQTMPMANPQYYYSQDNTPQN